jgi:hypothetical protein
MAIIPTLAKTTVLFLISFMEILYVFIPLSIFMFIVFIFLVKISKSAYDKILLTFILNFRPHFSMFAIYFSIFFLTAFIKEGDKSLLGFFSTATSIIIVPFYSAFSLVTKHSFFKENVHCKIMFLSILFLFVIVFGVYSKMLPSLYCSFYFPNFLRVFGACGR